MNAASSNFFRPHRAILVGAILWICAHPLDSRSVIAQVHETNPAGDCTACHTCTSPTAAEKCLRQCRREVVREPIKDSGSKGVPETVILDQLANMYLPVPFDHKGHAAMAGMTTGCTVCHHHTPQESEHPACRTCHTTEANNADIHKPGLKGAYHRQCLSCHREWGGEANCSICHPPRAGKPGTAKPPAVDDLVGRMHPPIPQPDMEVYRTEREGYEPSKVLFRHKEHASSYDLKCADCHHEDNCIRCHAAGKSHVQHVRTIEEHHQPCMKCHQNDKCESCHFTEGQPPPQPFAHLFTGWPLKSYHQSLGCRKCHDAVPYAERPTQCAICHTTWSPTSFTHAITGLELNDTHKSFDCEQCHVQKNFAAAPSCTECHEASEGITYPAKRPGKLVGRRAGEAAISKEDERELGSGKAGSPSEVSK